MKRVLFKVIVPAVIIEVWMLTCYPVCNKAEGFDWFLYWIIAGCPFGIRRMCLWLIPKNFGISGSIGVLSLNHDDLSLFEYSCFLRLPPKPHTLSIVFQHAFGYPSSASENTFRQRYPSVSLSQHPDILYARFVAQRSAYPHQPAPPAFASLRKLRPDFTYLTCKIAKAKYNNG